MAVIKSRKQSKPHKINAFLGLNENANGELKLGEASYMRNWRITHDLNLQDRDGYKEVFTGLTGDIRGMWYGKLAGVQYFLFCADGHLYSGNLTDGTKTDLGTITDAPTRFVPFRDKVYLLNGHEYKSFDGVVATPSTDSLVTVAGYVPLIVINSLPTGKDGTSYQQINLLTGSKRMTFTTAYGTTEHQLAETNIDSVDYVKLNGTLLNTMDYTTNLTSGKVTLVANPGDPPTPGNLEVKWTKGTGSRSEIEKCRFAIEYQNRLHLWGNEDYKNRRYWSGVEIPSTDVPGYTSAEYFEANSYADEGSGQFAITDIKEQYKVMKIYLEDSAKYAEYTTNTVADQLVVDFPSYPLNKSVGNVAEGQVQLVNNSPITLYKGVRAWDASNVENQTNERLISKRVDVSLANVDLSTAKTVNWQSKNELWINIGNLVWGYNYYNDTWYMYDNISATCFIEIDGELYFGSTGAIYKFDSEQITDNGTAFKCEWEMGDYAFDAEELNKYMNNIWISLKPEVKASLDITPVTNTEGLGETQTIKYSFMTFEDMDFEDFSFETSYNAQPFYLEVQASGFSFFRLILVKESSTERATILSIVFPARYGGKVR